MKRLWWEEYREAWFKLTTLAAPLDWNPPKGHKARIYTDGDFAFHESQIKGEFGPVEEQLWAFRNGLSDIVFEITIPDKRSKKAR